MRRGALLAGAGMVLGLTQTASACMGCSTSTYVVIPGLWLIGMHVGGVIAVLAAFVERPFISRAVANGYPIQHPLSRSIQASFLSTLLVGVTGIVYVGMTWPAGDWLALLWLPLAILATTLVEQWWLQWRMPGLQLRFGWMLLGNIASAVLVALLPLGQYMLGTDSNRWIRMIQPWQGLIAVAAFLALLVIGVIIFARTHNEPPPDTFARRGLRGFEVIPLPAAPTAH